MFLACGVTDMRKGFDGLAVLVQQVLEQNPHSGVLCAFRGELGHLVKLLWFDGQGLCLFSKRLDRGRFVWPVTATGAVTLTPAQLSMLLEASTGVGPSARLCRHWRAENGGFAGLLLACRRAICYAIGVSEAPVSSADATARIAALEASLAPANAALAARDLLIGTLRGQLARLRRMQFGASSEKLGREIAQLELALEELETESAVPDAEAITSNVAPRPAPVRSLPDHLPREEVVHEPTSGACTCPDCGGTLRLLGMDAHEMLDVVPVRWRVVRDLRPKYSCRHCEKIVQAPAPVGAVARGEATFATLAYIVVSKFDHHLPLYRQAEMMAAQGLDIDRSTLAGWTGQAAALLDRVVSRIRDAVLAADKIHADDTPVPVLDPGRGRTDRAAVGLCGRRPRVGQHDAARDLVSLHVRPHRGAPAGTSRGISRFSSG